MIDGKKRSGLYLALALVGLWLAGSLRAAEEETRPEPELKPPTQGVLRVTTPEGEVVQCPLKHTSVHAEVAGFLAEVRVRQRFHNPFQDKIEAVYVFPLPEDSAVDEMIMIGGDASRNDGASASSPQVAGTSSGNRP